MALTCYGGLIRAVRRSADLSQRQLAERTGVDDSVIARIEAGDHRPLMITVERLLAACGYRLQAVADDGHVIDPEHTWADYPQARDAAGRRFPAHLDVRRPTRTRPWWYHFRDTCGVPAPLLTFDLARIARDRYREADHRTARDPDERCHYPYARSAVHIPGYRPASRYRSRSGFW